MALTTQQLTTLRAAVFATPAAAALLTAGNVVGLMDWCNANSGQKRWLPAADPLSVEEAPSYTSYDSLMQGKRDSWMVFLRNARDFGRNKVRSWVVDIWGNATAGSNAESILQAGTANATNAQVALGGQSKTTGTVAAVDTSFEGDVDERDALMLIYRLDGSMWTA